MNEITTIGLDLAKNVFQVDGVDAADATVLRKWLRRGQVLAFFARAVSETCIVMSRVAKIQLVIGMVASSTRNAPSRSPAPSARSASEIRATAGSALGRSV
jgi:hypothetical protein